MVYVKWFTMVYALLWLNKFLKYKFLNHSKPYYINIVRQATHEQTCNLQMSTHECKITAK